MGCFKGTAKKSRCLSLLQSGSRKLFKKALGKSYAIYNFNNSVGKEPIHTYPRYTQKLQQFKSTINIATDTSNKFNEAINETDFITRYIEGNLNSKNEESKLIDETNITEFKENSLEDNVNNGKEIIYDSRELQYAGSSSTPKRYNNLEKSNKNNDLEEMIMENFRIDLEKLNEEKSSSTIKNDTNQKKYTRMMKHRKDSLVAARVQDYEAKIQQKGYTILIKRNGTQMPKMPSPILKASSSRRLDNKDKEDSRKPTTTKWAKCGKLADTVENSSFNLESLMTVVDTLKVEKKVISLSDLEGLPETNVDSTFGSTSSGHVLVQAQMEPQSTSEIWSLNERIQNEAKVNSLPNLESLPETNVDSTFESTGSGHVVLVEVQIHSQSASKTCSQNETNVDSTCRSTTSGQVVLVEAPSVQKEQIQNKAKEFKQQNWDEILIDDSSSDQSSNDHIVVGRISSANIHKYYTLSRQSGLNHLYKKREAAHRKIRVEETPIDHKIVSKFVLNCFGSSRRHQE